MTTRRKRIAAVAALAAAFVAAPVMAQDAFEDWDENHDAGIDLDEWNIGFDQRRKFERWDLNQDGDLSRAEFNAGVHSVYDINDDGILSEEEFERFRSESLGGRGR